MSDPLRDFAEYVEQACERAKAVLRKHEYVFRRFPRDMQKDPPVGDAERWEAMAFALYSDLGELTSKAIHALNEADELAALSASGAGTVTNERNRLQALRDMMLHEAREWRGIDPINNRVARRLECYASELAVVIEGLKSASVLGLELDPPLLVDDGDGDQPIEAYNVAAFLSFVLNGIRHHGRVSVKAAGVSASGAGEQTKAVTKETP